MVQGVMPGNLWFHDALLAIILSIQFSLVKSSLKRLLPILSFQVKSPMGVMIRQIKHLLEDNIEITRKITYLYLVLPEFTFTKITENVGD